MIDFSNVRKLDIAGKTAEYKLYEMDEDPKPVLIMKPIGSENKPFFNEMLRRFGGDARRMKALAKDGEALDKVREATRELFPLHVVTGWRNMRDNDGNIVEFSQDACAEFFAVLPPDMVDDIRAFADDPSNFRVTRGAPPIDAEALAGNSPGS